MAIIVSQVKTKLQESQYQEKILEEARKTAKIKANEIEKAYLIKSSVDARKKENILIVSSVGFILKDQQEEQEILHRVKNTRQAEQIKQEIPQEIDFRTGTKMLEHPPVIVGFGPAGMFAGLALARMGYKPIVLERGADVDNRIKAVEDFWNQRIFDPKTNVQFGEGGAGTFSDGKLTTRINDPRCSFILDEMIAHGAPEEIRHRQKPHVGTDLLRDIVKNIRKEILSLGGQVRFYTCVEDIIEKNGKLCAVKTNQGEISTETLILAVGHSARDTFEMLLQKNIFLEPKPFSVGVRIEQKQETIDRGLYGDKAGHPAIPQGEYQLSWRDTEGRGVYTFCMCPGGFVVASSSEEETVVTNGMSEYARDGENANSALVVSVDEKDFGSNPLDGIAYQRKLEKQAYLLGGKNYHAPAQSVKSFLERSTPDLAHAKTQPTFPCGVTEADIKSILPKRVGEMLDEGLVRFQKKLPGFADENAILTGLETRTSSPVRITRNTESMQAAGIAGLYPCGEGAGYAGGIMSAAVDGVRVAQKIMEEYAPLVK